MKHYNICVLTWLVIASVSCAINIEVTGQRTALERQIIGTQKTLNHDLKFVTSVRALDENGVVKEDPNISENHRNALKAKQNQSYLQDDIIEYKEKGIIGEKDDGYLDIKPDPSRQPSENLDYAKLIVAEENSNRTIIWQRLVELNPDIASSDLPTVQAVSATQIYESSPIGYWFYKNGEWIQKK